MLGLEDEKLLFDFPVYLGIWLDFDQAEKLGEPSEILR